MKRIMTYAAVVLAVGLGFFMLWQFRSVVFLFLLSLFVAASIRPTVDRLADRGFSKAVSQLLVYVGGIGSLLLVLVIFGNFLSVELNLVVNRGVIEYEMLNDRWQDGAAWQQAALTALPEPITFADDSDSDLELMLPLVIDFTRGAASAFAGLLLILALSAYWSADQYRFERLWLSLLPANRRSYARDGWREIENAVGTYIRSQTAQSVLAAVFLAIAAFVTGVSYPLTLAVLGALAAFIPLIGGLFAAAAALILGNLEGFGVGIGLTAFTLVLFLGLELYIEPRFWIRERRSFFLTILVVILLVELFGFWGLIVAPPLAAALDVLIRQAYEAMTTRQLEIVDLADIETRFEKLNLDLTGVESEALPPELKNLNERLADLLVQSRELDLPAVH